MPLLEKPLAPANGAAGTGANRAKTARIALGRAGSCPPAHRRTRPPPVGTDCRPAGMVRSLRAAATWLLSALLVVANPSGGTAGAAGLQPHRAIYKMALSRGTGRSDVASATGTMFYRFAQGCDGWSVENRTVLRLSYDGGGDVETVWTFASWESADGLKFRFYARYEQDGAQLERLEGRASLDGPGGGGTAQFSEPDGRTTALPQGTVFPTEHLRLLIMAAVRGDRRLSRVVFDGASIDNPYLVTAVMGPLANAGAEALAGKTNLPALPAWWTQMAFFPHQHQETNPEFEIGAQYRADGIADRIVQRFDTFALDVRLSEFEVLARPEC